MFNKSQAHILNGFEGFDGCCHAAKGGEVWIQALFKDKLVTTETPLIIQQPPKHYKTGTQRGFTVNANRICWLPAENLRSLTCPELFGMMWDLTCHSLLFRFQILCSLLQNMVCWKHTATHTHAHTKFRMSTAAIRPALLSKIVNYNSLILIKKYLTRLYFQTFGIMLNQHTTNFESLSPQRSLKRKQLF